MNPVNNCFKLSAIGGLRQHFLDKAVVMKSFTNVRHIVMKDDAAFFIDDKQVVGV